MESTDLGQQTVWLTNTAAKVRNDEESKGSNNVQKVQQWINSKGGLPKIKAMFHTVFWDGYGSRKLSCHIRGLGVKSCWCTFVAGCLELITMGNPEYLKNAPSRKRIFHSPSKLIQKRKKLMQWWIWGWIFRKGGGEKEGTGTEAEGGQIRGSF